MNSQLTYLHWLYSFELAISYTKAFEKFPQTISECNSYDSVRISRISEDSLYQNDGSIFVFW